ncbi:MAG TPA: DUF502 domain-containing protein [Phycisphaerales bacterium]|nr:DUF502 domain-containing protein [Phycisphaerales bacterium]
MSDHKARTFQEDFRRFFLRGLVILLPSVLTLWIVVKAYQFVDGAIAQPINEGIKLAVERAAPAIPFIRHEFDPSDKAIDNEISAVAITGGVVPDRDVVRAALRSKNIREWWAKTWYMNLVGLVVAIIGVYTAGRLLGGFLGRHFYTRVERLITTIPVVKQVYPYVKQVVDFLFSDEKPMKFNRVVTVEYPRKGIWSIGFLTGKGLASIERGKNAMVTVFIPSSPTPFTGYTITVPADEALELPLSVEEALRFVVSGGVLSPDTWKHRGRELGETDIAATRVIEAPRELVAASVIQSSEEPTS